ncbi:hypothetical protein HJC10_27080 [Corallococcus exiguus]|uniref:hypothetical protein n=1 Tax=Corallococcus TaxID=83461 RepID=UPI000EECF558|nr:MULTISPECIES: hypothetical protein [Corallococcus]NNB89689.1 hypothetical protein [Corallococcus exiguus]NNB97417.1 hypothetical protein [Corallococcus exiguus]NNC06501.1 hypothetical protein [Corallococcus exiguus]NPC50054.1 hypothetical protein [Corallococcus exiguus]RKH77074.1 hypothetical protein D7X99_32750 [Corallococcus sp. AB032C]
MDAVNSIIEIAGPLMLGLACGALFRKFVYPRLLALLGARVRRMTSATTTWGLVVQICFTLGLAVACHASNAMATLMWAHEHLPLLPFPFTLGLIHWVFLGATFFSGYNLALIPSSDSEEEQASRTV